MTEKELKIIKKVEGKPDRYFSKKFENIPIALFFIIIIIALDTGKELNANCLCKESG